MKRNVFGFRPCSESSEAKYIKGKPNIKRSHIIEIIYYGLLIFSTVLVVMYLFYFDPVRYLIFLIVEDGWGEYVTAINFFLTSMLFAVLLIRPALFRQKIIWAIICLAAFVIGAEEISWGQRILHISTPSILNQANVQNEFNFHNLKTIHTFAYHAFAAYIVLSWSIFSIAVSLLFPHLKNRIQSFGLPLIPLNLVLVFLTVPYLFLVRPVVKSDEVGELFLSLAVVILASHFFFQYICIKRIRKIWIATSVMGILLFSATLSSGMTYMFPGDLGWRLNMTASRDYPNRGMYEQAESVYEYIYSNPKYITSETMIDHARMHLKLGDKNKAFSILTEALNNFETSEPPRMINSRYLRRFGIVLQLLGKSDRAEEKFIKAIKIDEKQIESEADQNAKANLLWSIAQTLEARGDMLAAIETAKQARSQATSEQLRRKVGQWIERLNSQQN